MTLFVVGHGGRDSHEGETFVPAGMTVHFFARFDQKLLQINSAAVLSGVVHRSGDAYSQPRPIPNYVLTPQEIELLVADLTVIVNESDLVPVPQRMTLCSDVGQCAANGRHQCNGLFGRLRFDPDVCLLVCRNPVRLPGISKLLRKKAKSTKTLPGERTPEHYNRMRAIADHILELAKKDDARAGDYFYQLSSQDQAMLVGSFADMRNWSYIWTAKQYLAEHRFLAYYRYYLSQEEKWQKVFDTDTSLREAAHQARQYAEWFVNATQQQRDAARAEMTREDAENLRYIDERAHVLLGYHVNNRHLPPADLVKLGLARARMRNAEVISNLGVDWIRFHAAGRLLAVGDGHDGEVVGLLRDAPSYFPWGYPLSVGAMRRVDGRVEAALHDNDNAEGRELVEQETARVGGLVVTWVDWPADLRP